VTIGLSSSNTAEGTVSPASLTFTAANWNAPQTVTVAGVDDLVADGNQLYSIITAAAVSSDPNYSGMNARDVSMSNTDNDSAGITIAPTTTTQNPLITSEAGGQATFTVVLNSQPTASVTIALTSSVTTEGTVSPATLTFTTANWLSPKTVTVTGQNDFVADGNQPYHVTYVPSSADVKYDATDPNPGAALSGQVQLSNTDNDSAGITISPVTSTTTRLVTTEGNAGSPQQFTVVLNSQPTAPVTITLASSNPAEGTITAPVSSTLTFSTANWLSPQTVTVTGQDDSIADGNQLYQISYTPTSADNKYDATAEHAGVALQGNVYFSNTDNDTAGIAVSPTSGLVTNENPLAGNHTATFTVKLLSQPTAPVTFDLTSSKPTEGTVSPAHFVIAPAGWVTAQTVTVTGVDDFVQDGDQNYSIIIPAPTSGDPLYHAIDPTDVSLKNLDDDSAAIDVSVATPVFTTEQGGTATFTVTVRSQPTAMVTIPLTSSKPTEGQPVDAQGAVIDRVTFNPSDWSGNPAGQNWVTKTVIVKGQDDFVQDGNQPYSIVTGTAVSADLVYNNMPVADVSLTNNDNDTAGVTVSAKSGDTSESGTTATFTVALLSQPTAPVTLQLHASLTDTGLLGQRYEGLLVVSGDPAVTQSIVFTTGTTDWQTPRTITVRGQNDNFADGPQAYSITIDPAVSTDPNYSGNFPKTVAFTNADDDTPLVVVTPVGTLPLHTSESGLTAQFTVALSTVPLAPVTIDLASSNTSLGTLDKTTLTFAAGASPTAQTVTVTGQNDVTPVVNVGGTAYSITFIVSSAGEPFAAYGAASVTPVAMINDDNDTAGFTQAWVSGPILADPIGQTFNGLTSTISIKLNTQPTGDVFISVASDAPGNGIVTSPGTLTFTSANWSIPQNVNVLGGATIDPASYSIRFGVITTSTIDPNYKVLTIAPYPLTNQTDG
jgi:hypothetical protein